MSTSTLLTLTWFGDFRIKVMQKRFERSNFLIIFKFVILGSIKAETETKKLFAIAMYELDWFLQNSLEKQ